MPSFLGRTSRLIIHLPPDQSLLQHRREPTCHRFEDDYLDNRLQSSVTAPGRRYRTDAGVTIRQAADPRPAQSRAARRSELLLRLRRHRFFIPIHGWRRFSTIAGTGVVVLTTREDRLLAHRAELRSTSNLGRGVAFSGCRRTKEKSRCYVKGKRPGPSSQDILATSATPARPASKFSRSGWRQSPDLSVFHRTLDR